MANPARIPDLPDPMDPRVNDPALTGLDPLTADPRATATDPRYAPANSERPAVVNRVETRSSGSGVLIAAVVLVLAIVAYFVFAPASNETVVAPNAPAATEPAAPPAAPNAMAPATPEAVAPATPAEPAAPAPNSMAPAEPAPAPAAPTTPAPAQ